MSWCVSSAPYKLMDCKSVWMGAPHAFPGTQSICWLTCWLQIGNCAALAELQLSNNKVEVLPSALGNLKEKKVRGRCICWLPSPCPESPGQC